VSKFNPLTSKHPFTTVWRNIHARCYDPRDVAYRHYGGKGITVCERWRAFPNFYADMFPFYAVGLQIDRIDNTKSYQPDNCRWVTAAINVRNSSLAKLTQEQVTTIRLRLVSKPNQTKLAREFGVTPQTICDIKHGRSWL